MYERVFKRWMDIIVSGTVLIVLFPLFIILIVTGMIKMKGNPFFVQPRYQLVRDMKIICQTVGKVLKKADIVREGTVSDMDFGD